MRSSLSQAQTLLSGVAWVLHWLGVCTFFVHLFKTCQANKCATLYICHRVCPSWSHFVVGYAC